MTEMVDLETTKACFEELTLQTRYYVATRAALRAFPALALMREVPSPEEAQDYSLRAAVALPTLFGLAWASSNWALGEDALAGADETGMILGPSLDYWSGDASYSDDPIYSDGDCAARAAILASQSAMGGGPFSVWRSAHAMFKAVSLLSRAERVEEEEATARGRAASQIAYAEARLDIEEGPGEWKPLWQVDRDRTVQMRVGWDHLRSHLRRQDKDAWAFWIAWYDDLARGVPVSWELTRDIVAGIQNKEWQPGNAGAIAAAQRIAGLQKLAES